MDRKNYLEGLAFGSMAYLIWGLLPLYWRLVHDLSAYQLFAQRVIWSFVFVLLLLRMKDRTRAFFALLKDRKIWKMGLASAFFISVNWLTYIWGVNNGYVVESSLGYYINPLVLTLFGRFFFQEKMTRLQGLGLVFALIGVLLSTWFYHRIPVVGLTLAVSFAVYGVLKKKSGLDSLDGLTLETLVVSVPSLLYVIFAETTGQGISGNLPFWFWGLIALSGIATAVPLLCYAEGAKKLPLNVMGFLQYISPTISLILGITVFKESFDGRSLIAFGFIWFGLILFTYSQYRILSQKTA